MNTSNVCTALTLLAAALLSSCAAPSESEATLSSAQSELRAQPRRPRIAPGFTAQQWQALLAMTPLPEVPPDTTNAYGDDRRARVLGQKFFFDPGFSGPLRVSSDLGVAGEVGKVSCASCHSGDFLDDRRSVPRTVSLGADFHTRNAPAVANSSFYTWTNWGGRFSAQWELPMPVTESPVIMNGNRLKVAHRIFDHYRTSYERIFGPLDPMIGADLIRFPPEGKPKAAPADPDGAWESMSSADRDIVNRIFVNYSKALGAYFRVLVSRDSPFDQFMDGDCNAMDASAQSGAKLFIGKARCAGCHSGPHFSNNGFHNLGVPQSGERVPALDDGRFRDVPPLLASPFNAAGDYSDDPAEGAARLASLTNPMPESTRGAFRTPTLRGVALTEPYMHSGQLATLRDVIEFYNQGGGTPASGTRDPRLAPLGLTEQEKSDLVAFLYALTGEAIAKRLAEGPRQ